MARAQAQVDKKRASEKKRRFSLKAIKKKLTPGKSKKKTASNR